MFRVALLWFGLQAFWVLVLALAAIGKVVEFGWAEYVQHFTNWSWTLQTLFYAATLASIAWTDAVALFVGFAFFPLVVIVASVWLGSSLLLIRDPAFITNLFDMWPPGVVMVGNDVYHVLPVIVLLMFAWLRGRLIMYGLRRVFLGAMRGWGPIYVLALGVWQVWAGALLVVGVYRVFFDPNDVYMTTLPEASALGLVLATGLLVAGLPLAVLAVWYGLFLPPPHAWDWQYERQRVLLTSFEERGGQAGREPYYGSGNGNGQLHFSRNV